MNAHPLAAAVVSAARCILSFTVSIFWHLGTPHLPEGVAVFFVPRVSEEVFENKSIPTLSAR